MRPCRARCENNVFTPHAGLRIVGERINYRVRTNNGESDLSQDDWHIPGAGELESPVADWLLEPGSLTARIRARCPENFRLRVLREARAEPAEVPGAWPSAALPLLREVTLDCAERPLVFARTLIPDPAAATDRWLLELGDRPLGDVLFQSGGQRDDAFEVRRLVPGMALYATALDALRRWPEFDSLAASQTAAFWARRSWVHLHGERLLICECFLPGLI